MILPDCVYLDHNATSPLDPRVAAAMHRASLEAPFNPASSHQLGRHSYHVLQEAREQICRLLGANVDRIPLDRLIITSGGTESNNQILRGMFAADAGGELIVSAVEHPSVLEPARHLARLGIEMKIARVLPSGILDLDHLASLISPHTRLVSVQMANHETGVLQPLPQIVAMCLSHGIPIHTDAAQSVGKIPIDFQSLEIDAITIAPHKFQGPRGVGGLLVSPHLRMTSILHGGPQQLELRPGTESVATVVGTCRALEIWQNEGEERRKRMQALAEQLWRGIQHASPEALLLGSESPRLPHVVCVAFPGLNRQALTMALDLAGVACSTGSACASGSNEPSPVLLAMGFPSEVIQGAVRFSLGATTTAGEIELAISRIADVLARLL